MFKAFFRVVAASAILVTAACVPSTDTPSEPAKPGSVVKAADETSPSPQEGSAEAEQSQAGEEVIRFMLIPYPPMTPVQVDSVDDDGSLRVSLYLSDRMQEQFAQSGLGRTRMAAMLFQLTEGYYLGLGGLSKAELETVVEGLWRGATPATDLELFRVQVAEVEEDFGAVIRVGPEAKAPLEVGEILLLSRPAGSTTAQLRAVPDFIALAAGGAEGLDMDPLMAARLAESQNNLKQIGLAMHNYHDVYRHFPPAVIYGPDGKPWHSWRVLVLPFLEQISLYDQYKFDEPWDGPNNKQLLKSMPSVYRDPIYGASDDPYTHYAVAVGKGTGFPPEGYQFDDPNRVFGPRMGTSISNIRDGTSNTLLVGSVSPDRKIPWTKPEDVTFDEAFPGIGQEGGFAAPYKTAEAAGGVFVRADGSATTIRADIDPELLRNLIRIDDGQAVGEIPELVPTPSRRRQQALVIEIPRDKPGAKARLLFEDLTSDQGPVGARGAVPPARATGEAAQRAQSANNLRQLMLALHNYHDVHRQFPPAFSTDQEGKPLLSWRVQILPYVEQQALYRQFHLDEPWDSEHNKKLIASMPPVFRRPGSKAESGKTDYLGVGGPKGVFPGKDPIGFRDIKDGTSYTAAVVEVDDALAVVWTKPGDFVPNPDSPKQGLLGAWEGGFQLALSDGSVRFLSDTIDNATLFALFTRDGGEAVDFSSFSSSAIRRSPSATLPPPVPPSRPEGIPIASTGALRLRTTLQGHASQVRWVAFSPDGKTLATASFDLTARLWELPGGKERSTLKGHAETVESSTDRTPGVNCVAFSQDGKTLATAGLDGTVKLWDAASGKPLSSLKGHAGRVFSVTFAPDGNTLASASEDRTVKIWDVAAGTERATLQGHTAAVECVDFAPDGKILASGGWRDGSVILWEVAKSQEQATLKGHVGSVLFVAFSPDGKTLATGGEDRTIKLWDPATRKERAALRGHTGAVRSAAFTPDGTRLATGGADGTIKLWDVKTGRMLANVPAHSRMVWTVAVSPDGNTLASGGRDTTVKLWDMSTVVVDRYAMPVGGPDELLAFIEDVRSFQPETPQESAEHGQKAAKALTGAAQRILKTEKDQWSKAYQTALRVLLEQRVDAIVGARSDQQRETAGHVKTFLTAKAEQGFEAEDVQLALSAAGSLEQAGNQELAAEAYQGFAELIAKSKDEDLLTKAKMMEGAARRLRLLGQEMKLEGTTIDGEKLDWEAYRGKVVLVRFWDTTSDASKAELPSLKLKHRLYHGRGFEVVGVSTDRERDALEKFLKEEPLPWTTLHEKDAAGGHPMATYYGVTAVPTAFLVDKDGKVVSLQARGAELDTLLQKLLGPPHVPQGRLTQIDLEPKANQKLTEALDRGEGGNDLADLPRGDQTFGGVKFRIADALIQLAGKQMPDRPEKVEQIPIDQDFKTLYILHATQYGTGPYLVEDGTVIGQYVVHYEDKTTETIPIVYGEDVRNWWNGDGSKPVARSSVVWRGGNAAAAKYNLSLRLYLTAWQNPQPGKKVTGVDYASTNTTDAAPFCVAMTAEAAGSSTTDR